MPDGKQLIAAHAPLTHSGRQRQADLWPWHSTVLPERMKRAPSSAIVARAPDAGLSKVVATLQPGGTLDSNILSLGGTAASAP